MRQPSGRAAEKRRAAPPSGRSPTADCAHATERAEQAPVAMVAAEELCRKRGVRLTPIRRQVLECLYATHRPLGAYDLAETLALRRKRRVAPITVYRALEFLLQQSLVHRLVTRNAYVACPHHHGRHDVVAFLICEKCGGVDEASSPGVGVALGTVLKKGRFAPREQIVEIAGLCGHCQERDAQGLTPRAARSS